MYFILTLKQSRGPKPTSDHAGRSIAAAEVKKLQTGAGTCSVALIAVVELQAHEGAARLPHGRAQEAVTATASRRAVRMRDLLALKVYAACIAPCRS